MPNNKLEWKERTDHKVFYAESKNSPTGSFRIFYDDVMYWPSWSKDCSQDLEALKKEAQDIHDQGKL